MFRKRFSLLALLMSVGSLFAQSTKEHGTRSLVAKVREEKLPDGARIRLGSLGDYRYTGAFSAATMSLDGKRIAVSKRHADAITVLDIATGKTVQVLRGRAVGGLGGLSLSSDGQMLAEEDTVMRVWSVASGKLLHQFPHLGRSLENDYSATFSKDNRILAAGGWRSVDNKRVGEVKAWNLDTGKIIGPFATVQNLRVRAAIAPDGKTMVSWGRVFRPTGTNAGDRDNRRTLQLWDLRAGKELRRIMVDVGPQSLYETMDGITCAEFSPDGKTLAVATGGITYHLIDIASGRETRRFSGVRTAGATLLRFSPDGRLLIAYDSLDINRGDLYRGAAQLQGWEVETGKRLDLVPGPKAHLLAVGFPAKGRVLVLGDVGQGLYWWDAMVGAKRSPFSGHLTPIATLVFTPDGKSIISAATDYSPLIWWNRQSGAQERTLRLFDPTDRHASVFPLASIALSPDGRHAAINHGYQGSIRLWDLTTGGVRYDFEGPQSSRVALAFSPDGKKLSAPGTKTPIHQWDIQTGQELLRLPFDKRAREPEDNRGGRIVYSLDGTLAAVHAFYGVRAVHELIICDPVRSKQLHRAYMQIGLLEVTQSSGAMAISCDNQYLGMSVGRGKIFLVHTYTGKVVLTLESKRRASFFQLAFTHDGRFLAAGVSTNFDPADFEYNQVDEPMIELWELATGRVRETFRGHTGAISCLALSPDGTTLASGSHDTTIFLWDLTDRNRLKLADITAPELPDAWRLLGDRESPVAATMRRMVQTPGLTLPFLKSHLAPVKREVVDHGMLARWVADLGSENFKTREQAGAKLARLHKDAESALRKALELRPTIETKRRIEALLQRITDKKPIPKELQAIRAVEILERIGNSSACELLSDLSKGDPRARLTKESLAALKRLESR